jgi:intracellular septation protein A
VVPISFFYVFHRFDQPLAGALLAIGWSIGLLGVTYWRSRRIELFPALVIPIIAIELVGTLITRNPAFYLASAAIENALWALVFLGSILISKPLIQIFAELLDPRLGSKAFLDQLGLSAKLYRSAWQIITAIWGVISLSKAILLIFSQLWLHIETFIIIRTASGIPVTILLLLLSYRFPEWYWKRATMRSKLEAQS